MKHKLIVLLLVVALLSSYLIGCASSSSSLTGSNSTSSSNPSSNSPTSSETIKTEYILMKYYSGKWNWGSTSSAGLDMPQVGNLTLENITNAQSAFLSSYLRVFIEYTPDEVESLTYEDALNEIDKFYAVCMTDLGYALYDAKKDFVRGEYVFTDEKNYSFHSDELYVNLSLDYMDKLKNSKDNYKEIFNEYLLAKHKLILVREYNYDFYIA